jgi:alanyl-tRNA synthetase
VYAIRNSKTLHSYEKVVIVGIGGDKDFEKTMQQWIQAVDYNTELLMITDEQLSEYKTLNGSIAFKLYDTYGFPLDLTQDVCRERGIKVDTVGFEREMTAQRERARAASHFDADYGSELNIDSTTEFDGYEQLTREARVVALFREGQAVDKLEEGERGMVVLDATPFYAESGGQVGDCGRIQGDKGLFEVRDTRKQGQAFVHLGQISRGSIALGERIRAEVDNELRADTARHHSATHLLHAALRKVLGEHVQQKGSLVSAERLRFDFVHFEAVTAEQMREIEALVNAQIRANIPVTTELMAIDQAKARGAMALFGEKYGDEVRVLSMGDFSIELCGGTHVSRTGDIGLCKVVAEGGTAAGVRRIEAVCGQQALAWLDEQGNRLLQVANLLRSGRDEVVSKLEQTLERSRKLEKELEQLKGKLASSQGDDLAASAVEVGGIQVLAARLDGADPKGLRDIVDQLKNKLGTAAVLIAAVEGDKISLVAGVSKDATDRIKAGELLKHVAEQVGGKGGGRPDMAQGGGNQPQHLDTALKSVVEWVSGQVNC